MVRNYLLWFYWLNSEIVLRYNKVERVLNKMKVAKSPTRFSYFTQQMVNLHKKWLVPFLKNWNLYSTNFDNRIKIYNLLIWLIVCLAGVFIWSLSVSDPFVMIVTLCLPSKTQLKILPKEYFSSIWFQF